MPIRDPDLTPESIRAAMAIPSTDRMRGLKDGVGFATTPAAMAAVFAAATCKPSWSLGTRPAAPWIGAICPHDDFLYAGRVYRQALQGITAKTVVLIGTFHGWRKFEHGLGVFDSYENWFAPDGAVRVSSLRSAVQQRLGPFLEAYRIDDAAFDHEHSLEPIVAWLRHRNPEVEILPFLPPSDEGSFDDILSSAKVLAGQLQEEMSARKLEWGRDVAVVISADAVHYGPDFEETRYGQGGKAYFGALKEDLRILAMFSESPDLGSLAQVLYETFVDPQSESRYRWTWCGRYAIPFGLVFLMSLSDRVKAWPMFYETSITAPPLDLHMPPLGFTAPATFEHFVGYPAVAFTFASPPEA